MKKLSYLIIASFLIASLAYAIPPSPPSSSGAGDMTESTYVTAGKIKPSTGGTGQDTSSSTGFAYVTAGTWSVITVGTGQSTLHIDDILTALGIASGATHFGTFTGSTIADSQTAKAALQALETAVETKLTAATAAAYTEPAGTVPLCRTAAGAVGGCTNVTDLAFSSYSLVATAKKLAVFSWDGGGSAVTTGATTKRCTILPGAATIVGAYAIADASTTTHLHVYQDAFAAGSRSTTVTGAVDIGATLGSVDTTLTGWDKSITAADEICMSVEANNNAKWIQVVVYGTY